MMMATVAAVDMAWGQGLLPLAAVDEDQDGESERHDGENHHHVHGPKM